MIIAESRSVFSWSYRIYPDGEDPVDLKIQWMGESAKFVVEGVEFQVCRQGFFSGQFTLEALGRVQADASKPSAFYRTFEVETDRERYEIEAQSPLGRTFLLLCDREEIGILRPTSIFSRTMECDLPEDIPLPVRIFFIALVIVLWRRQNRGAGSG